MPSRPGGLGGLKRNSRVPALLKLPLELWREIFEHITDDTDLFSVALLSRSLQREAETVLYRIVELIGWPHMQQFNETIASSGRRAANVRALKLIFEGNIQAQAWQDIAVTSNALLKALAGLRALHVAHRNTDQTFCPGLAQRMLEGCTFQLTRFTTQLVLDDGVIAFLAAQPHLEDLHILGCNWVPPVYLPADTLPRVRILAVDLFAVGLRGSHAVTHLSLHFVDGRHVQRALELFGPRLVALRLNRCDLYDWREYALPFVRQRPAIVPCLSYVECCIWADTAVPNIARHYPLDFTNLQLPHGPITTLVWTVKWNIRFPGSNDGRLRKKYHSSVARFARRMLRIWPSLQRFVYLKDGTYHVYTLDEHEQRIEAEDSRWHDAMWQCV